MREDLLNELENEYAQLRADNERTEEMRKEKIRIEQPHIYELTKERENIVFGTLRNIVNGSIFLRVGSLEFLLGGQITLQRIQPAEDEIVIIRHGDKLDTGSIKE